jgi:hypothetical protein
LLSFLKFNQNPFKGLVGVAKSKYFSKKQLEAHWQNRSPEST